MFTIKLALALVAATGWQSLPPAPIAPEFNWRTSVWTGKQMLVFGRDQAGTTRSNVAASYDPQSRQWRKLSPPQQQTGGFMNLSSVWTGKEMLVWGQGTRLAYNPAANTWRQLPGSRLLRIHDGFGAVVWTGKEMLGWGGGCCGDAFSDGVAYNPATNTWRALPHAPLQGNQHPLGVWTGKRYVVISAKRMAAYDPALNSWRLLPTVPVAASLAAWNGDKLDVIAGNGNAAAYRNRWQRLPSLPHSRVGAVLVSDGVRLFAWSGGGGAFLSPGAKKWTVFPRGPVPAKLEATAVWTGNSLIVWGGSATKTWGHYGQAGGTYTPPVLQQACGDAWMAENLRVTPAVKEQLRRASGATHSPLAGHTYYGRYSGVSYAIATFAGEPTVFRTDVQHRWRVRAQTNGTVCSTIVPVELLRAWSLPGARGGCFALPR
jgi:hypothetical protein